MENKNVESSIRMMTKKERYTKFRSDVEAVKAELKSASTSGATEEAIGRLAVLMEKSVTDSQLKDIIGWTEDVKGTVKSLRMHDCTRKEMVNLLDNMLTSVDSKIAAENDKETVEKMRKFFLACAEHAEEISKIEDIKKIFG